MQVGISLAKHAPPYVTKAMQHLACNQLVLVTLRQVRALRGCSNGTIGRDLTTVGSGPVCHRMPLFPVGTRLLHSSPGWPQWLVQVIDLRHVQGAAETKTAGRRAILGISERGGKTGAQRRCAGV